MLEFLGDLGVPTIVVITKIDKLGTRAATQRVAELSRSLGLTDDQVIPFSAVTGAGRDELAEAIVSLIAQPSWRTE
jgi:GTP-binding protein